MRSKYLMPLGWCVAKPALNPWLSGPLPILGSCFHIIQGQNQMAKPCLFCIFMHSFTRMLNSPWLDWWFWAVLSEYPYLSGVVLMMKPSSTHPPILPAFKDDAHYKPPHSPHSFGPHKGQITGRVQVEINTRIWQVLLQVPLLKQLVCNCWMWSKSWVLMGEKSMKYKLHRKAHSCSISYLGY